MNTLCDPDFLVLAESYKILALFYHKPSKGIHDNKKFYDHLIKSACQINQKALEVAKRLSNTRSVLGIEEQIGEYVRLFENGGNILPSLLGTRYLEPTLPEPDDSQIKWLTDIYSEAGFETGNFDVPPDHIFVELLFINHLLINEAKGLKEDDMSVINHFGELRCKFVREHMANWVPEFTRCIITNSKSPYYIQLAILTRTIIVNCPGD